jgi:hypothetical protein
MKAGPPFFIERLAFGDRIGEGLLHFIGRRVFNRHVSPLYRKAIYSEPG